MNNLDIQNIVDGFNSNILHYAQLLFPNGKKQGSYWVTGDVYDTPATNQGSFKIGLSGRFLGMCRDFSGDAAKNSTLESYDLLEVLSIRLNGDKAKAIKEAQELLGISSNQNFKTNIKTKQKPLVKKTETAQEVKVEPLDEKSRSWQQTLHKELPNNESAIEYLHARSLKKETIVEFQLGLTRKTTTPDGEVRSKALATPIRLMNGEFAKQQYFYVIPHVTENPIASNGWGKSPVGIYFSHTHNKQRNLIVCEGMKDVWVLYQNLKENDLLDDYLVCSGTHGTSIPEQMKNPDFWAKFDKIYLTQDFDKAGDTMAEKISEFIVGDCYRVRCPAHYANPKFEKDGTEKPSDQWGADWTDFFRSDGCIDEFLSLLEEAPVCSITVETIDNNDPFNVKNAVGRFHVAPIDINGAYINRKMYYPVQTLMRKKETDEYGQEYISERYETVVVSSDGVINKSVKSPAPPGTPDSERVIRLTDGTLIRAEPKPNDYSSWSWNSIESYISGRSKIRSAKDIYTDIHNVLKQSVWLPVPEDYCILSLTVIATYVQNIFESVPIIFLNGRAGSGKSQTGIVMSKLSCNGSVIGQVSAATAARHIDASRGFVVFDDLEGIASKGGRDGTQFSDLVQALKVSYNKNTSEKIWTDVKTMKTERLNFFGIKLISNTQGSDDILSTRMLRIQTLIMPDSEKGKIKKMGASDFLHVEKLRQELHQWAFAKCNEIEDISLTHTEKTGRFDEIALPLRVIASLVGKECADELEVGLNKQKTVKFESNDPIEVLREAVKNLIKNGFIRFTVTQLILELRTMLDDNYGASMTNEIPEWERPEWVGRQLRTLGLLDSVDLGRAVLYGKRLKVMQFNDYAVNEVIEEIGSTIDNLQEPFAFCAGCASCPYANTNCGFREERLKKEQKNINVKYN